MRPKLKEVPKEWSKFATSACAAIWLATLLVAFKKHTPPAQLVVPWVLLTLVVFLSWVIPSAFRPLYRVGMTVGFYFGQVVGRILLAVLFILAVLPLGLLLRLFGKDLLALKRKPGASTYWHAAKPKSQLDQQF